jgi:hypothetical protein
MSLTARPLVADAFAFGREKAPGAGQDRWGTFETPRGRGVVVSDGVGTYADSGEVAEAAVAAAREFLQGGGHADELVPQVNQRVRHVGGGFTTLLAATVEQTDRAWLVDFAGIGNGSVIEFAAGDPVGNPWMWWTDHFVPHVDFSGGKDTLSAALPCPPERLEWTSGRVRVHRGPARLFLLCSDGIASIESYRTGRMPDGSAWREIPELLDVLLGAIRQPLLGVSDDPTSWESLFTALQDAVDGFADTKPLDDDASFAALLLPPSVPSRNVGPGADATGAVDVPPSGARAESGGPTSEVRDF